MGLGWAKCQQSQRGSVPKHALQNTTATFQIGQICLRYCTGILHTNSSSIGSTKLFKKCAKILEILPSLSTIMYVFSSRPEPTDHVTIFITFVTHLLLLLLLLLLFQVFFSLLLVLHVVVTIGMLLCTLSPGLIAVLVINHKDKLGRSTNDGLPSRTLLEERVVRLTHQIR